MITGSNRTVYIDGVELSPARSQGVYNHSPDGFMWGYPGSGPAQLALALLLEFADKEFAAANYQAFKTEVIAKLPDMRQFQLSEHRVKIWITMRRKKTAERIVD